MEKIYLLKKYSVGLAVGLLAIVSVNSGFAADTLTASTSLTVVNVTNFPLSYDVTTYSGAWPDSDDDHPLNPDTNEVYLKQVVISGSLLSWETTPYNTPYTPFPNTVNSMIAAVWSDDGGKTFSLKSWDYLASNTHGKHLGGGMPDCWMGTMIHTICGRKAGECNGKLRTNLRFSEYPSGTSGCWGDAINQ